MEDLPKEMRERISNELKDCKRGFSPEDIDQIPELDHRTNLTHIGRLLAGWLPGMRMEYVNERNSMFSFFV